jgi:hypothetical protein
MPIYVYETMREPPEENERFERIQKMADEPLTEHPYTGEPIRRIITAPASLTSSPSRKEANLLSDKNVGEKGFTKYEKVGDGKYERTAGTDGPKTLQTK